MSPARTGEACLKIAVAATLMLALAVSLAGAEDTPYAEYRVARDLGRIEILTGYVERTESLIARRAALEARGIVILETDTSRALAWKDRIGRHTVETRLTIEPPVGHGEGGASSQARLVLTLDGAKRADCSLGVLDRIALDPQRGFVTLEGHDGILRFDGFESRRLVDDDWLAARAEETRNLLLGGAQPKR